MRRLFLKDAAAGDLVDDVFVITGRQLSATATGKFFIKAFLSDRTGQIAARMWNATRDIFNALPEAGFIKVRGRVENYQNNLQFIIDQCFAPKEGEYDVADLIPHTTHDIGLMFGQITELCQSVQNRHLNALLQAYLDDEKLMEDLRRSPAAMTFHHAYLGGLLEHTLNSMKVADAVVKFYPGLNRDLLLTGIFLHDLAKTWELRYECAFDYSDGGRLIGHVVKGAMWIERKAIEAEKALGEPIPQPLIDVLQHILLSHHGETSLDFGSARTPCTPEAFAVHMIENMDAKMMMALSYCRGEGGTTEGNWTEYLKAFNGRLYRPDVAPQDAQAVVEMDEVPMSSDPSIPMKLTLDNPLFEQTPKRK